MLIRKVIIADDEEAARILLQQYLADYPQMEIIAQCQHGIEAVSAINRLEPDLLFLDIQMPGLSGFQVLRQIVHVPQIIFTTAYDRYALKAFDSNAIDYLLKPYTRERFNQAMAKLLIREGNTPEKLNAVTEGFEAPEKEYHQRIFVESGNKMVNLNVDDIIVIEAEKDYSRLHTQQKSYLSNFGIGVMEQRLNPAVFIRVHRSYIININHVLEMQREGGEVYIVMRNNVMLKASRGYREKVRRFIY